MYVESKVKSEIRELGSNSNNIMGDKLCLHLCGFYLVCCIIENFGSHYFLTP